MQINRIRRRSRNRNQSLETGGMNGGRPPKRGFLFRLRFLLRTFLLSLLALGCSLPLCAVGAPEGLVAKRNILYYTPEAASDPKFTSLDYYALRDRQNARIMVFVHGGGWTGGDKSNVKRSGMVKAFMQRGFAFVAVNTRLVGDAQSPDATYAE